MTGAVLCICGGVGGAKLALGFAGILLPEDLGIVVNVGDDFEHLGLHVSPDIDTVMYTLSGLANRKLGWGREGESWNFMEALGKLGGDTWFRLGDQDLATHVRRTGLLKSGASLSEATALLSACFGIRCEVMPATDQRLRTMVETNEGMLPFQQYFVARQCAPAVQRLTFDMADGAVPSTGAARWLTRSDLAAIVICPSNPYLSIDPILAVPGMRDLLKGANAPIVAISPLIGGKAVKGPTAKIMGELGLPSTALEIARHYHGFVDLFILDHADETAREAIQDLGIRTVPANILMQNDSDKKALAKLVLEAVQGQ